MPVPDPAESRVLLVGTASYQDESYRALPAVENNLIDLKVAIIDPSIWGLPPDNVKAVLDPWDPKRIIAPLQKAAREATDTLLFYYAGHGYLSPKDSALYLTCNDSSGDNHSSALEYKHIREVVLDSRARRKVVILDCCFSGNVHAQMGVESNLQSIEGAYVLTSTGRNQASTAPPGLRNTAFTDALLILLKGGISSLSNQGFLTLDNIYRELHAGLPRKSYPRPDRRDHGNLSDLPLVRNRAYQPSDRHAAEGPSHPLAPEVSAATAETVPAPQLVVTRDKTRRLRFWRSGPAVVSGLLGTLGGGVVTAVAGGVAGVIAGTTAALLCYVTTVIAEGQDDGFRSR
ncbi:caspase family protein [Micromonospora arida]|uniref:caspase family protein n=1 Tax=Micromonospora arida TaxID=2203715 RepID=UPI0013153755|nr:caspase family protein [Micromonospora arida]